MEPWHIIEILAAGLCTVLWWKMRDDQTENKSRIIALESQLSALKSDHARSEERDKAFEAGIARLTKAIDDFDSRIGAKIEQLSEVVNSVYRRFSPPQGMRKVIPREDKE